MILFSRGAPAQTFDVTNANGAGGPGSLYQAVDDANAFGAPATVRINPASITPTHGLQAINPMLSVTTAVGGSQIILPVGAGAPFVFNFGITGARLVIGAGVTLKNDLFNGVHLNLNNAAVTVNGSILAAGAHGILVEQNGIIEVGPTGTIRGNAGITKVGSAADLLQVSIAQGGSVIGNADAAMNLQGGTYKLVLAGLLDGSANGQALLGGAGSLELRPGYEMRGIARSPFATLVLGGAGAASFDAAQINPPGNGTEQFQAFDKFAKTGTSTWTLTGTNPAAMPWAVDGGTLVVGGTLANATFAVQNSTLLVNGKTGAVTVQGGGLLGGSGQVGSTTINSGGTLSPGNSIGVINVNGNLVLGAGAIYLVEVSPTSADRTNVSGTAQLGGELRLLFQPGTYASNSYTILSAAGGRSGTFNTVTTQNLPATLSADITYTPTDALLVTLTSQIAPVIRTLPGTTANQRAAGAAQDTAFNGGLPSILALYNLPLGQLPGALDQLTGEVHASTIGVLADESRYLRDAVLGRLRQASYGGDASMASLSVGGPVATLADGQRDGALAYARSPIVTKAPPRAPQTTPDVVFWAQGFGARGRFETDGNAATLRRDLAGFISGVDTRVGSDGRLGIAAGYTGSKNALDGRGTAEVETAHIAGYGGWRFGAFNLRAGGGYASHTIATDRPIAFPGFFDRTTANYDGHTGQVFGELGYGFAFGSVAIEPFAGAAWVRVKTDAAAERGGAAALDFAGATFETGYTTLGIRTASMIALGHDMMLVPRGALAWQHAFDTVTPAGVLAFQAAPVPFTIAGVPIARDSFLAEVGLDLAIGRHATLGVSYVGQLAGNVQDHAAKGKFSWRF